MKAFSLKYLFIEYSIICLGSIPIYLISISLSHFLSGRQGDLDYISELQITTILLLIFSVITLILVDFIFNVIGNKILKNIELYILVTFSTILSAICGFFVEATFLPFYFLFNILVFGLYLLYLKYLKN